MKNGGGGGQPLSLRTGGTQSVVLDGRHIQDHFPGIGRYVFNLADCLPQVAPEEKFRVIYDPRLRNTRYDVASLARWRNVELVTVNAPTFSLREQWLGQNRAFTAKAALWHSAFYVLPYFMQVPCVITLEDVTPLVLPEEMPNAGKRILYRALNLLAAGRAARIITISLAACADLQRVLGIARDKITVVPLAADARFQAAPAVDDARVREQLNLPGRYVLYLGSNKPHKNLTRLVQAWARVDVAGVLVLAGHWDERYPEAKLLAEKLGLQKRVLFRHDVPGPALPALIRGAQTFVFPSVHEGFGLPPLEALACGTPVVCANASSLPEVVGEAAILFDPLEVDSIAAALTRVLEDAALRETLREQGLIRAQKFSWEQTARETLDVYRSVMR